MLRRSNTQAFLDGEIRKQEAARWQAIEEKLESLEWQAAQIEERRYELHWEQWLLVEEADEREAGTSDARDSAWQRFSRPSRRTSAQPWYQEPGGDEGRASLTPSLAGFSSREPSLPPTPSPGHASNGPFQGHGAA